MNKLLITIYTKNRPTNLAVLLSSILSQDLEKENEQSFDLLIVDDNSKEDYTRTDPTIELLLEQLKITGHAVYILRNMKSKGIANNRNKVWDFLKENSLEYEFISDMNDDHWLVPNYYRRMLEVLESDEKIGAVCSASPFIGRTEHPSTGNHQVRTVEKKIKYLKFNRIQIDGQTLTMGRDVDFVYLNKKGNIIDTPVEVGHGSIMTYRSKATSRCNKKYSVMAFTEETDLSLQIRQQGFKIVFLPSAIAFHFQSPKGGIRDNSLLEMRRMRESDTTAFKERWADWLRENGW